MSHNENVSKLNADIKKFAVSMGKKRELVQGLLIRCAAVAFDFDTHKGNVDPFTNLVNAATGLDAKALIGWIEKYAPAIWRKGDDGVRRFTFNKSFKGEFDEAELKSHPWWEFARTAQNTASTVDMLELLRDWLSRQERAVKKGEKTILHADIIREVKAVVGRADQAAIPAPTAAAAS